MASYHHQVSSGKKGSALRHALYIARQGQFGDRDDLVSVEYGNLPSWSPDDPFRFFAAGDKYERANGAVYREHVIALPSELNDEQRNDLVDQLIQEIAGCAPHLSAVHRNKSSLEGVDNLHLHLMTSDRVDDGIERSPEKYHMRANAPHPELGGCKKRSGGRSPWELGVELAQIKKRSAELQNEALRKAGVDARVDHRSLKEQGIDRMPERHQGQARIRSMSAEERKAYVDARCTRKGV